MTFRMMDDKGNLKAEFKGIGKITSHRDGGVTITFTGFCPTSLYIPATDFAWFEIGNK